MDCASSQKVSRLVGISMLQKEVLAFRKAGHEKDKSLKDKDDAIEMLAKKVETLTKEMEVEAKKMRREVATMEKEVAAMQVDKEHKNKSKRLGNSKSSLICSQMLPGRYVLKSIYKLDVRLYKGLLSVTQDSDKDMNEGGRLRPWEELERSKQQSFSRIGNVTVSGITVVYPYLQANEPER